MAIENDVHILGISTLASGHMNLVTEVIQGIEAARLSGYPVVVGGVIPPWDFAALQEAGAGGIFGPGTRIPLSAQQVLHALQR
jgi:methylmalonyl-CoA mutase